MSKMAVQRAKILAIGVSVKVLIYVSEDSFNYVVLAKINSKRCVLNPIIWF